MQDKITKCLGLVTQYSPLSIAPGALRRAKNIMIRRKDIIEPRRGHSQYASFAASIEQLLTYSNRVLVHRGTSLDYDNGSGTFASYSGSYSAPSGAKMRFVEAFSNLYATTSTGVRVFSNVTGTAGRAAGAPRALDPSYTLTGATGFLSNTKQCAYRSVIVRTDAQSNVIRGYPSQRLWVTNSAGGSRNVILTNFLPQECVAGDVLQVYRTEQVDYDPAIGDAAGDEAGLVYQYELVSADITAGFVTFTDSIVDELRGATLYTAPSQEGIGQANERPPLAKDIALYKSQYMLFANCSTKQRLQITLVGAGSLSGKTITLAGITYSFGASEIISGGGSPQVRVSSTGVAAFDIDETARSLVRVINRYALNTSVYAYYLTGPGDLPGQIMIEEKGVGAAAFTVQASDTAISGMFFPQPPVSPSTNSKSTSTNSIQKNYVYYSKAQQPEHVPLLNYLPVGPANKEILRIVALEDSAIVIKEEGIYRITGETPTSFSVIPVDLTVRCKAANSVAVLSNQVFMLSDQGVVAVSETDAQVVSYDIEPDITPLLSISGLADRTYGMAYESERCYMLSTVTTSTDTAPTQTWVYNASTKVWMQHSIAFVAALIETSSDRMFFAKPSDANLYRERKSFLDTDYADPELTITILSISEFYVDFTVPGTTPQVGWVIEQNGTEIAIEEILSLPSGYRAILRSSTPAIWTTGAATLYPSVGFEIEYHGWTGQNPDMLKQVRAIGILADDTGTNTNTVSSLIVTFRTNFDDEQETVDVLAPRAGWGSSWGSSPWGGGGDSLGYPTWVPRNKQYCTRLNVGVRHVNAREKLSIAGVAMSFEVASERIGR